MPSHNLPARSKITLRAVLIGILLIPLNYFWIVQLEFVRYSLVTYLVPYYTVIFIISVLIILNAILGKLSQRFMLSYAELGIVYIILSVTTGFCSHNMMEILVSSMGHGFWFATVENDWQDIFWKYIPRWLTVANRSVLQGFYDGDSSLYTVKHLRAWLIPALSWTGFIFMLVVSMVSINSLIRKQWSDRERLTYPIIQLPMQMMDAKSRLFRNRLMWIGFSVAAAISILNGLHYLYPVVPHIKVTRVWIGKYFTSRPWKGLMRWEVVAFYPFAIGIGFIMPMDLAFSVWFFYLFHKMVAAAGFAAGLPRGFPYIRKQTQGAYIGLVLIALWMGREHLKQIVRDFWHGSRDAHEPMSYRHAVLATVLAFMGLVAFSVLAGMQTWVAIVFFIVYFLFSLAVTRIHTELGYPVHDMISASPRTVLLISAGTANLSGSSLTVMALYRWFNRSYASHPMPHQLDAFHIADTAGMGKRRLVPLILGVSVIGSLAIGR